MRPADEERAFRIYAILTLVSGIFWTIVYIDIIYRGFKDKACGMPLMVLGLNWSWEFIFAFMGDPFFPEGSFFHVTDQTMVQRGVDAVWFLFDCVILCSGAGRRAAGGSRRTRWRRCGCRRT